MAHLLGRKHDRIEPLHALKLVPVEVGSRVLTGCRTAGRRRSHEVMAREWRSRSLGQVKPGPSAHLLLLQVPLKTMLPFLEGALRSAGEKRRNAAVVRSLRRSENLQVREENVHCKQRYCLLRSLQA